MSKPIYVSASQIDNFRSCNRRWWFKSIKKIAEPSTDAQIMGTRFAKAVECRLKNEQIPKFDQITDLTIDKFLAAAEAYFPAEPSLDIYAERKIDFTFPDMPARMIGYIDVLDLTTPVARIRDHKTRSDKRYAPTHEKLASDLQLNIYAFAMRHEKVAPQISIGHINYIKPPKAQASNAAFLRDVWQPEVFLREIPLDEDRNESIMADVRADISQMIRYADPLANAVDIPLDATGEACFSYGQPCPYSSICPKFSLNLRPTSSTAMRNLPPPPPSRSASSPVAPPAPPAPVAAVRPNAPPPPPSRTNAPPPPPNRAITFTFSPSAAPVVNTVSDAPPWVEVEAAPPAPPAVPAGGGINPPRPRLGSSVMASVPVASIPNLTAATKEWLASIGFRNSEQVAHITEQYLAGFKTKKSVTTELLKVADVLRGLHGVEVPNPFDNCPTFEKGELVVSPADIMADLPDHGSESEAEEAAEGVVAEAAEPVETAVDKSVTAKRRGRPPASAAVDKPAPAPVAAPVAPTPTQGMFLYLECAPIKGAQFVTLEEFLDPVFSEVERACGVQNWRSITEFGRLNEMLHVALRNIIEGRTEIALPQHLVVLSIYTEYAKATLDLLIRHATIVVRK